VKRLILLSLMLIAAMMSGAVDNRFLYPLGHIKGTEALNIDVTDGQVLVRNQRQIWIYSTFNAWQPRLETGYTSLFRIEDVNFMGGNYIYVSSREPTNMISPVDSLNQFGKIYFTNTLIGDKITREGSTLYVADRYRGIDIINVGRGGSNDMIANFSEKWGVRDFVAEYPYLYALNDFGLVTVDISDQNFPLSIATNYQLPDARYLAKNREFLYIASGKDLIVLSVRDLSSPVQISQTRLFHDIQALAVKDNRLFVALGQGGVKIFDISIPNRPLDLNTFYPPHPVYDLALENDYIYIAMGKEGWMIYEYR
jgi:hypothetical protein